MKEYEKKKRDCPNNPKIMTYLMVSITSNVLSLHEYYYCQRREHDIILVKGSSEKYQSQS